MPDLIRAVLDWVQTPLGATIVGGLVVVGLGGLIGLVLRRGQGPSVRVTKSASGGPMVTAGSAGQPTVIDRTSVQGLNIMVAPGGQATVNVYLDGLPETRDARKKTLFEKGRVHQEKNEHEEAIHAFRACLVLENNTPSERAALLILIGISFYDQSRLSEAEGSWREALGEARAGGDREGEAAALGNLGLVYRQQGDLDKAGEHHQQALEIHREIGHRLGEATQLGNLGLVYHQKGALEVALEHYQAALKMHREIGYRLGEAQNLGNLGNVHHQKGELDKALEHYRASLVIEREIGYRLGEAQNLGNLGLVYQDKRELERALEYLQQAKEIFRAIGARAEVARTERNIARLKAQK